MITTVLTGSLIDQDETVLPCLVRVGGVNTIGGKTIKFCLVSTQFPICTCSVSNILRITEDLETGKTTFIEAGVETRAGLSTRLTRLQPRAPLHRGPPRELWDSHSPGCTFNLAILKN